MLVLHTADLHVGRTIRGRSRLSEFDAILADLVRVAIERDVDLVIVAGDTFDTRRPGPDEIRVFAKFIAQLRSANKRLLITGGNHDAPPGSFQDVEGKTVGWMAAIDLPGVDAIPGPGLVDVHGYRIYTLPYPHKRAFDHLVDLRLPDRTEAVSRAVENMIELAPKAQAFVGHLSVLNAELSADQAMRLGWDVTVRPEVFDRFGWTFLGHIHRMQRLPSDRGWYSGSPFYSDFGERTQEKGYLLVNTDASVVQPIPSPAIPMRKIVMRADEDWTQEPQSQERHYTLVELWPAQPNEIPRDLKARLHHQFREDPGLWIETHNPPKLRRSRIAAPAANPLEQVKSYLSENDLPASPTLDVAAEIITAVDP